MKTAMLRIPIITAILGLSALVPALAQAPPPDSGRKTDYTAQAKAALARAQDAAQANDLETARRLLTEFPKSPGPVDPAIESRRLFQLAVIDQTQAEQGTGDPDASNRAIAGYKRVLALRPNSPGAYYNLGRIYDQRGDTKAAARTYAEAAKQPGKDQALYLQRWGDYAASKGLWPEAEAAYESAVILEPRLDEPYRILSERYLANPQDARLLSFLWQLVGAGQEVRAQDLALRAIETGWPESSQTELLTVVAASLGQRPLAPAELLKSTIASRLGALTGNATVGRGARELLTLYKSPGSGPIGRFEWWDQDYIDPWADHRGIARRDAIRMVLRSVGDWYQEKGDVTTAATCYRAAIDDAHPDPVALRKLADVYVETSNLEGLNTLAAQYTSPEGKLFQAKNEAYRTGQLETVLEYHRALGRIYGNLADNGLTSWGSESKPDSAMFQLSRAYSVGEELDKKHAGDAKASATHIDPDLAVLLAKGYQATGDGTKGNDVRLKAADHYEKVGDTVARDKVLHSIPPDTLNDSQKTHYQKYNPKAFERSGIPDKAVTEYVGHVDAPPPTATDHTLKHHGIAQWVGKPPTVEVPANVLWVDTGLDVKEGQSLVIHASGQWSNSGPPAKGPEGFAGYHHPGTVADADLAALIARIGDRVFQVGAAYRGAAPASGRLYLSINDTPDTYGDNEGALSVTISLE